MDPPAWAKFKTHEAMVAAINHEDPTFFEDFAAAFREAGLRNRHGPFRWFARATAPAAGAGHAIVREWPRSTDVSTQTEDHEIQPEAPNTEPRTLNLSKHLRARVTVMPVERRDAGTQTEWRGTTATVGT